MDNIIQARKLIEAECANYQRFGPFGVKNFCWMKEKSNAGVCVFFNNPSPQCLYFEQAVLPLDEDLKESMEEMKNAGIKNRAADSGSGAMQSPESKPGNPPKVSVKRVSLGQHRGEGLLSRARFHGMASQNPEESR